MTACKGIVLLGPKHSGKTSAGAALAKLLDYLFIDLDGLIALETGKTPRELYRESPERFRQAEAETLERLFQTGRPEDRGVVIAAGGGIIDNPQALEVLQNQEGFLTVCLEVSAETAWRRITQSPELPPFLDTENPRETHRLLHERRSAAYRAFAAIAISGEDKNPEELGQELMNCWQIFSGNFTTQRRGAIDDGAQQPSIADPS